MQVTFTVHAIGTPLGASALEGRDYISTSLLSIFGGSARFEVESELLGGVTGINAARLGNASDLLQHLLACQRIGRRVVCKWVVVGCSGGHAHVFERAKWFVLR